MTDLREADHFDIAVDGLRAARHLLAEHLKPSPLVALDGVCSRAGQPILVKAESLQPTGSFKIRGAMHVIGSLSAAEKQRGVIAYSTGNHAQAVARAARTFGTSAVVVMSEDAPQAKIEATRAHGAEIVMAEPSSAARRALAERLSRERGLTLVPPYDHPGVITGQGTIALELLDQIPEAAVVFVPIGGGGLIAGIASGLKQLKPSLTVIGVEPELENDAERSFRSGKRVSLPGPSSSGADAIKVQTLGDLTFPLIQHYVDDIVTVTEQEILQAMRLALTAGRLALEPAGAVALAAALSYSGPVVGTRPLVAIGSGGNIDIIRLCALLGSSVPA